MLSSYYLRNRNDTTLLTNEDTIMNHNYINFIDLPSQGGNASNYALEARNIFTEYFPTTCGSIPWQQDAII